MCVCCRVFEYMCCTSGGAVCAPLWIPDGARTPQNTLVHLASSHTLIQRHSHIQKNSPDSRITWAPAFSPAARSPLSWRSLVNSYGSPESPVKVLLLSYLCKSVERSENQLPGWDRDRAGVTPSFGSETAGKWSKKKSKRDKEEFLFSCIS